MAIRKPPGPPDGMAAISRALPNLMWRGPGRTLPLLPRIQASQPIQLFMLKSNDISSANFLEKAVPVGWRYLIVNDGPVAVADVNAEGAKQAASFASLIRGPLAERLVQAAELAERKYGADSNVFDVRILEIPSLYVSALWLHGDRDVFIPFLEGGERDRGEVQEDPSFQARVRAMALAKTRAAPNPEPSR